MNDRTERIKNLAIAFKALSGTSATTAESEIESLLEYELDQQREENNERFRTAKPSITTDDEIPF